MRRIVQCAGLLAIGAVHSWSRPADACGCFAPPNAAEPIVQAGERILFAVRNGVVTAHIQVQYAGDAKDFGWLLPLPSVPTLTVGTDELFTQLAATTQPSYVVEQTFNSSGCSQPSGGFALGCASPSAPLNDRTQAGGSFDAGASSPLVIKASVGPYDYAVLRADDRTAMFQWLTDNRFFVPAGTDAASGPYIRPGAYFLALKLKAGAATGDITPVVLQYPSALPMIPLILTSVGAQPNMGVQVFLLGSARGIPRNYHHVVLNDALLGWLDGMKNYSEVVSKAVAEAPQKHAFVTEYAGPSSVMRNLLAPPQRFGTEQSLALATSPDDFVSRLVAAGFADRSSGEPALPSAIIRLLLTDIPFPPALASKGISENEFLTRLDYYLGAYRTQNPDDFTGYTLSFDARTLAQEIFAQYVTPVRDANALFDEFPTLTRLFTTLSPEDMTEDPVFSFNAELPMVKREHTAKLSMGCGNSTLVTEQGWVLDDVVTGSPAPRPEATPVALRVETLGEEGQATVVTDNTEGVHARFTRESDVPPATPAMKQPGCSTVDPLSLGLFALMAGLFRRRLSR